MVIVRPIKTNTLMSSFHVGRGRVAYTRALPRWLQRGRGKRQGVLGRKRSDPRGGGVREEGEGEPRKPPGQEREPRLP